MPNKNRSSRYLWTQDRDQVYAAGPRNVMRGPSHGSHSGGYTGGGGRGLGLQIHQLWLWTHDNRAREDSCNGVKSCIRRHRYTVTYSCTCPQPVLSIPQP